jgi:cell division protein FtsI/penicillin-binding protein 2
VDVIIKGMWGVVNAGGTGARIALKGFDIAGKTGTAQVTEVGKDFGENTKTIHGSSVLHRRTNLRSRL